MIELKSILNEMGSNLAMYCPDDLDMSELANLAGSAINTNTSIISASTSSIELLWAWLEKNAINLYARFMNQDISVLSSQINASFKQGADGAQIFVPIVDLPGFVSDLLPIRADLFFNKKLFIGINIAEVTDWQEVISDLNKISADGILLYASNNSGRKKKEPDFVGQIYSLANFLSDKNESNLSLHFYLANDLDKVEQVWRLFKKIHPKICANIKFFIH